MAFRCEAVTEMVASVLCSLTRASVKLWCRAVKTENPQQRYPIGFR